MLTRDGDMRSALELLMASGLRPNRDIAFHVVRACFNSGRPDLAIAYCKEFEANGLPPRPLIQKEVEAAEKQISAPSSSTVRASARLCKGLWSVSAKHACSGSLHPATC